MTEERPQVIRAALRALDAHERRLTDDERARRRRAGRARRKRIEAAGSYRLANRNADGTDSVERR